MSSFLYIVSGILFAVGLGVSGMTNPHVVRGFLDIFGNWNPSLLGVMASSIAVHAVVYRIAMRRQSPVLESAFHLPGKRDLDRRLITGSVLFGLGWGWAGICPGPGLVALVSGDIRFIVFVLSLLTGMVAFQFVDRRYLSKR